MGAKYFNNSLLTLRKRAREQEVQQGLVLDAEGAAVRGDRLVPVLHEEVSENISNRKDNNTRNVKSEKWAKATWYFDQRGWGKASVEFPLTHLLVQGVRVSSREAGRDKLLPPQTT